VDLPQLALRNPLNVLRQPPREPAMEQRRGVAIGERADHARLLYTRRVQIVKRSPANHPGPLGDPERVRAALAALSAAAGSGAGNLLELSIAAARARATVGEISQALAEVFGRHRAPTRTISGVYGEAYRDDETFRRVQREVARFAEEEGRRPRMLVAKLGQDGHDRGAKIIATAFADIGAIYHLVVSVLHTSMEILSLLL
jgi:hypothetical protein